MSTWARPGSDRTQRFSENLPRTLHSAIATGRAIVSFRTLPGPSLLWSGAELQPSNIVRHPEGESAFQRSVGSACFASVSLPVGEMVSVGQTIAGLDLTPPKDPLILTSSPSAIVKLRRLHAAATDLARLRRERNRWFADSPLEGDGFELPVPRAMQARFKAKIAGFGKRSTAWRRAFGLMFSLSPTARDRSGHLEREHGPGRR